MSPNQNHGDQQPTGHDQEGQKQQDVGNRRLLPGAILVGIGLLALFSAVDLGPWASRLILALIFGAAAYFAYMTGERKEQPVFKWAAAALAVLAVAALFAGGIGEALVVGVFALAFYFVWRRDKLRWWALIPAGALATIAVSQLLDAVFGSTPGWLFLAGLALTFYALTRLEVTPQRWGIYPAVVLAALAALTLVTASGWVGPLLLIGVGVFLLIRSGAVKNLPSFGAPRVRAEPQGEPAEPAPPSQSVPPSSNVKPSPPTESGREPDSDSSEETATQPTSEPLPDHSEPDSDADA